MGGSVGRVAVGLLVGLALGFLAANWTTKRGPELAAVPARPAGPSRPASPEADHAAAADDSDELSDEQMSRAKAAVDAMPGDYEAQFKLAEALLRLKRRPDEAIVYYTRANKLKPDAPEPLVGIGDANFAAALQNGEDRADPKRLAAAASVYARVLAKDPKNAGVRAALGMTYYFQRPPQLDRAVTELRRAAADDPKNQFALQGLASALAAKGDVEGAEQAVSRLETEAPNSPALAQAKSDLERARAAKK